jgi:uncharacterized membrane protein
MPNNLDSVIQQIVSRAASEIAQAVRVNITAEIGKLVPLSGGRSATAPKASKAPAASAAKAARTTAARPAARPAAGKKRRGVSEDELSMVLDYISRNPGRRGEEIRKALNLPQDQNSKILAKLRELKKVKTKGEKRTTAYSAA